MKEDFFGSKNKGRKDPLDIDFKETTKSIVKGVIFLGIGVPLLTGIANSLGGHN